MTVEGHVENGQIVLNQEMALPEGMKVRVEFVANETSEKPADGALPEELPSLYERMKPFVGAVKGLPSDFAINHARRRAFSKRADKSWSLTDCISFVVMQDHGLSEALTADHHFEQAGFVPVLK